MDIEELNRQMSFFQNDYKQPHYTPSQSNQSVNFPEPLEAAMPTIQIKRPTRTTGTHRNEINDKMAQMKLNQPMMLAPNQFQSQMSLTTPTLAQSTRNNSSYQNQDDQSKMPYYEGITIQNQNQNQNQNYQKEHHNPLSAYFQQNYSTLNGMQNIQSQQHPPIQQKPTGQYSTHDAGQSFVNPSNLPILTQSPMQTMQSMNNQQQPGNGYHRVDEKRIDYRQNMNSKVGDFIFDNPNAIRYNPAAMAGNPNSQWQTRDTRMVIQDSSKDMYRQESNSRMAQYSPLARASHVPINIANMSVNDFYAGMNSAPNYQTAEEDARAVLNARMGQYSPLAKATPLEKPPSWQANNVNQAQPLVAHDELPIISH